MGGVGIVIGARNKLDTRLTLKGGTLQEHHVRVAMLFPQYDRCTPGV
jgi:hypothetical protein